MIADLPTGYAARGYRGAIDHQAFADICNADSQANGVDEVLTAEDIKNQYDHLNNCDPATDVVVVEHSGTAVAYGRTDWWDTDEGRRYLMLARTGAEHRPVLRSMIEWLELRIAAIAADHPEGAKEMETWAPIGDGSHPFSEALRSANYRIVTYGAEMLRPDLRDIPGAPLPDGLEIRPVGPDDRRAIWEADKEAFRDHWGFSEPTEDDWQRFVEEPHQDPSLWKVAFEGDQIVGQVRTFINEVENAEFDRLRGWTENISTIRRWRKRGVARALICESLRQLRDEQGMTEAALGVHVENPTGAFALYEGLGYRVTQMYGTFHKPVGR
ncbi:MAG: GNAT family N-acetyltransferase [Acidimicrobiia bacterium]